MEPEDYVKLPYSRVFIPEESGGYSCSVLELPGCFSCGDTLEEAWNMINDAIVCWVDASLDLGHEIPTPFISDDKVEIFVRLSQKEYRDISAQCYREKIDASEFIHNVVINYLY